MSPEEKKPNRIKAFFIRPGAENQPANRRRLITVLIVAFIIGMMVISSLVNQKVVHNISYSTLLKDARHGKIVSAAINNSSGVIAGQLVDGSNYLSSGPVPAIADEVVTLRNNNVNVTFNNSSGLLSTLLPYLLWIVIFGGFMLFASRQAKGQMNGMMGVGRSKAKQFDEDRPKTKFSDVAGYAGVKQEISEVVEFLKTPERYKEIGAAIPKGMLLIGPPGTGKTMLARAVAGEAGVPFFSVTGSDFMEMFVGVGASRVRDLFATARKNAPAIIFVDEIDSIGRKRGTGVGGGHDEREQTLNQMLSEMDGFDPTIGVVVMAATNRADILDDALLRPGRFDRQVVVSLPDLSERLPILEVHSRNKPLDETVDLSVVARGTPGMSGADLANLVNEAALHAVRRDSKNIGMQDFESARDRVFMGMERDSMILKDSERDRIAIHESGHALLAYVLDHSDPLHKITLIPRGMALGVTWTLPKEDQHITSRQELEDSLCMRVGGRVAELLVYGDLSTGASNDLAVNTQLAREMVMKYGMSKEVGPVTLEWGTSERTGKLIEDEVERILREQESRAIEVLTLHRRGLEALAAALIEQETLDGETAAGIIDEAFGEQVHPTGTKTVAALSVVGQKRQTPKEIPSSDPSPDWEPPTLPTV
ncbi:MAG: ATP-dependent zinc metalloprotease FtsH [Actinomycetota bacterium]